MLNFLLYYVMLHVDAGGNRARHCHLVPGRHLYALYGKNSFTFAASTLWNSLRDHFRTENSFSQFKSLLQSWNGSKCRCSACRWLTFCFWFAYIFFFILYFLGNDHLTWRGGYGFFLKKIFCFPMLLKKIFWFWWRKKK